MRKLRIAVAKECQILAAVPRVRLPTFVAKVRRMARIDGGDNVNGVLPALWVDPFISSKCRA